MPQKRREKVTMSGMLKQPGVGILFSRGLKSSGNLQLTRVAMVKKGTDESSAKARALQQDRFSDVGRAFLALLCMLLLSNCNSESAPDCLQNAGDLVRQEVSVPDFTKVTVFENIALVLKQGDVQRVEIETGKFLRDEVTASVEGNRLLLRDTNDCNFFRNYGGTTIFITSPNIDEVRSSTGWSVTSDGVLGYDHLSLISESYNNPESETTDGEFDLEVDSKTLSVVVNGIAYFQLTGNTENFNLTIAAGDSRIEATNLIAQNINLNHRGSNDMFVNPLRSLSGIIRGTGDVISVNRPDTVSVKELYKGRLVFK